MKGDLAVIAKGSEKFFYQFEVKCPNPPSSQLQMKDQTRSHGEVHGH